ncbi:MAG: hypothetical protein GXP49_03435 [Deltaproteobacteria bacterium]|nr:hypothetical protein [Deltaproteobacteria bacterium]
MSRNSGVVPPMQSRRSPVGWSGVTVFIGFTVLSLAITWPAPGRFFTHLAADSGDAWQFLFNIWWVKKKLTCGGNLFHTDYVFYPYGANLFLHTLSLFNSLPAALLSFFMDYIQAYNLVLLVHYPLAGFAAYKLFEHVTHDRPASFVSAAFFAFSPFHLCHGACHMQLCAVELLPLALLFLLKTLEEANYRNPVWAALFVVLSALSSWYFLVFLFLLFAVFAGVGIFRRRKRDRGLLRRLALLLGIVVIVLGPMVIAMVHARLTVETVKGHSPWYWSADLQNFFVPGQGSALGSAFKDISKAWTGNREENSAYLGYTLLVLAFFAFKVRRQRLMLYRKPFVIAGLVFLFYSLGPYLHFGGKVLKSIPLPMALLDVIPLGFGTAPVRATLGTGLCLAGLACVGLAGLRARLEDRKYLKILVTAGVLITGLAEFWPGSFPTTRRPVPDFFGQMAAEPANYSVLDMRSFPEQMYGIIRHEKPLVNGHVARDPVEPRKKLYAIPVVKAMMARQKRFTPSRLKGGKARALKDLGKLDIRYIIRRAGHSTAVEDSLGFEKVYQGKGVKIFLVPALK